MRHTLFDALGVRAPQAKQVDRRAAGIEGEEDSIAQPKAIDEARRLGKPVLLCNPENLISAHSAFEWIVRERIDVLNIAGPRSSEFSGIYGLTVRFLLTLLGLCAGEEADKSGHEHRQKE